MLTLWTYRFLHPGYRQWVTLDCAAVSREAALASAVRFLQRENRRLKKAGGRLCPVPHHINFMHAEAGSS